eukprot:Em0017g382a
MKALALILVSLVISCFPTAALTSTGPSDPHSEATCKTGGFTRSCPFVPCSIAKCPRLPSAKCHNDYCDGCNHKYYLRGYDVTARCGKTSPGVI